MVRIKRERTRKDRKMEWRERRFKKQGTSMEYTV